MLGLRFSALGVCFELYFGVEVVGKFVLGWLGGAKWDVLGLRGRIVFFIEVSVFGVGFGVGGWGVLSILFRFRIWGFCIFILGR